MTIKITIEKTPIGYYIRQFVDGLNVIMMSVYKLEIIGNGIIWGYGKGNDLIIIIAPSDYDEIEYQL